MFPTRSDWNIKVLWFYVFSGCGIFSNTLLILIFGVVLGFIMMVLSVFAAMEPITCTQQDTVETTQVNSTNTSDLILFIIVANLIQNGADMEYI
jgi:hypothetical protein